MSGVTDAPQLAAEGQVLAADQGSVDKNPQGRPHRSNDDLRVQRTAGPARHVGPQGGGRELNKADYNSHNAPWPQQQGRRGTSGVGTSVPSARKYPRGRDGAGGARR